MFLTIQSGKIVVGNRRSREIQCFKSAESQQLCESLPSRRIVAV